MSEKKTNESSEFLHRPDSLPEAESSLENQSPAPEPIEDRWSNLSREERFSEFRGLSRVDAEEFFLNLPPEEQKDLFEDMPQVEWRGWLRILPPDDVADLIQQFPEGERFHLLPLLDGVTLREVTALLAYAEDDAGGLMNPRFIRLRHDVPVDVAIRYLRAQARQPIETLSAAYVLGSDQRLLGVVKFRDLLLAQPEKRVSEIMETDVVTIPEDMDQEQVSREFSRYGLDAIPVVDAEGRMKGVITVDDVVNVVEQEATEDIQKLGGTEALDDAYLRSGYWSMVRKRAGWLTVLFVGEMLTATAMGYYEKEIERAVVLALFIPLIISSGGNSGSQATSLIIRSLALEEVRLADWWRVLAREVTVSLVLGGILGLIGMVRIMVWPSREQIYGPNFTLVAVTVGVSLVGVVLWGSIAGSMLPFLLRRLGFDPATASAPLVATLVDVTGLVLYFTVASFILHGALL